MWYVYVIKSIEKEFTYIGSQLIANEWFGAGNVISV